MSRSVMLTGEAAEDAKLAMAYDEVSCPDCNPGNIVRHTRDFVRNGVYMASQCDSRSRWYNPKTKVVEGRAHCTCDYCF
jgi:hypothetical protein